MTPPSSFDTWSATGQMTVARTQFTATLLPNGQVLAAGGDGNAGRTSELFDPVSGSWTATTGSMSVARTNFAALLLPTGKVLVAGGEGPNGLLGKTAELYDPTSGTWSSTGSLSVTHNDQTTTLLLNGQVLLVGGKTTAELYDPTSGTWSSTGSTSVLHAKHTATLLPNGRVLVAGGGDLSTVELYDPTSGTWSTTNSMSVGRTDHTATLLFNGKVLVVGGERAAGTTAELYDPTSGTWSSTGPLSGARADHTATRLSNGKVLIVGGGGESGSDVVELYDPVSGTWSVTGSLTVHRINQVAILLMDTRVLVAGGTSIIKAGTLTVSQNKGVKTTETYLPQPPAFLFDNRGTTYNAWCHVNYTDPTSRQALVWDSGQFGQDTRSASVPAGATNISLEGGAIGGAFIFQSALSFKPLPTGTTTVTFSGTLTAPTYALPPLSQPPTFTFDNSGTTYTAWCHVNYTDPSGQATTWDSGYIGQTTSSMVVPAGATNITLEGGAIGGAFIFSPPLSVNSLPAGTTTITFAGTQTAPIYSGI